VYKISLYFLAEADYYDRKETPTPDDTNVEENLDNIV
jgi:hypothetical protein